MADAPTPFLFDRRVPAAPLDRFVESLWYARGSIGYARERIAPTGSTVAVLVLGDPILQTPDDGAGTSLRADVGFVAGPHDRPVVNEPTGETNAIGIVTTPVGCGPILGHAPRELRGRVVDLAAWWPAIARLRAPLISAERDGATTDEMITTVEDALRDKQGPPLPGTSICERAIDLMRADPARRVEEVAASLDLSHGHLDRLFSRVVGLSPLGLSRILRMRRLLADLGPTGEVDWARIAVDHGWFDQSHLVRDFRRYTGVSPAVYVAAQRDVFDDDAASTAGFVPER